MKKDDRARYDAMKHDLQVGQLQSQEFLAEAPPTAEADVESPTAPPTAEAVGRLGGLRVALLLGDADEADLDEAAALLIAEGALVDRVADAGPEAYDALLSPAFARAIAGLIDDTAIL